MKWLHGPTHRPAVFLQGRITRTYLAAFFGSAFLAVVLTPLVSRLARRIGAVDRPNARSVHCRPIPRIGGVAIFMSAMALMTSFLFLDSTIGERFRDVWREMISLLCSATFIFVVGLIDDLKGLRARFKLMAEILAAAALCIAGLKINCVGVVDGLEIHLGWLAYPATIVWVLSITNAVNLSDGLDGLAAGVSAIACGVIAVFAFHSSVMHTGSSQSNNVMMVVFALTLLGSLYGFLLFNFNPARIFMGDCGSLFLGFTIASASVMCVSKSVAFAGVALPALALGIPIFDTLFSMLRRFLERRSLFAPDRSHIHHRLLKLGLKHRQAVLAIYCATLVITSLGLLMIVYENVFSLVVFAFLLFAIVLLFRMAGAVRLTETLSGLRHKHAMSELQKREREIFEDLQLKVRDLRDAGQAWETICEAACQLGFAWIAMTTEHSDGRTEEEIWRCSEGVPDLSKIVTITLPLGNSGPGVLRKFEIAICVKGSLESANRRATLFGRLIDEGSVRRMLGHAEAGRRDSHV